MKIRRKTFLLLIAACLAGCATTDEVKVSPILEFPTPLVEPLPLAIGVYYPDGFRNFVYDETKDAQGTDDTTIDLGAAQVSLFDHVLPSVFSRVTVLDRSDRDNWPLHLDAVLVPQVTDVEYSVPRTSKANVYEVWIKYRFELLARDGTTIARWEMPTYGKTPTAFLKSSEEAINLASVMALRDCGAAFVTGFARVPEVAQWLNGSSGALAIEGANELPLQMPAEEYIDE